MRKVIFLIALLLAIGIFPQKTLAAEKQSDPSAILIAKYQKGTNNSDVRAMALENVFKKYNSPLAGYGASYVKYADKYGVDWKLLPSISGLESYFGTYLMPGSYNAYGWGGGYIYFESWDDGIDTINHALRDNYIDRGADDVWSIGPIYAESKTWSVRVSHFMDEINREYIRLNATNITVTI